MYQKTIEEEYNLPNGRCVVLRHEPTERERKKMDGMQTHIDTHSRHLFHQLHPCSQDFHHTIYPY